MRAGFAFICALLLCSCYAPTLTQMMSSMGAVSEQQSGFDGRYVVQVTGSFVMPIPGSTDALGNTLLGGRWESSNPDNVELTLSLLNGYDMDQFLVHVESFSVNLDGVITRFAINSKGLVKMPLPYLGKMLDAKLCRIQILRGIKTSEGDFTVPWSGDSPTAKPSLKRFYDRVLAAKAQPSLK